MNMNLKKIRLNLGLSQKEIAEIIGCSSTVYSRYETGERQPSIDILISISQLFNVSVDYIIGNSPCTSETLSSKDKRILLSFYNADERAQQDALTLLEKHKNEK